MDASTRYGLARQLASLEVRAASLPPSAVLLVRRLADPRPRSLNPSAPGVRPPPAWEQALQQAIDRAGRHAVRPASGPVPSAAEAVLFLDPAELLACLARDLVLGTISGNWWWQAWLRASGRSMIELVLEAWFREASGIPGAVAALHDWRQAVPFAEMLSPRQARGLFTALTEAFELPALAAPTPLADVPILPTRGSPRPSASRTRAPSAANPTDAVTMLLADSVTPPWEQFVPHSSVPPALGLEQRTFLGVALALARAPLAVRTRAFQRAFHVWRRAEQWRPPASREASLVRETENEVVTATRPVEESGALMEVGVPPDETPLALEAAAPRTSPLAPTSPAHLVEPAGRVSLPNAFAEDRSGEDGDSVPPSAPRAERPRLRAKTLRPSSRVSKAPGSPVVSATIGEPVISAEPLGGVPRAPVSPSVRVVTTADPVELVRTGLAGVFFLINALKRLELFDRLDDHFGVTSSLGGWAWLEIIARCLLGSRRKDAISDPIWEVLASLDGRDPAAAVSGTFRGPRSYRLPENWPSPDGTDATPALRRRLRPLGLEPRGDLRRFLDTLVPYLRWRLLKGLALEAPSARDEEALLVSRLFYRHGQVSCTRTHVDLHMGMGQVDIAIRLAGLDANPGWVPALGRVVTFHYD